MSEQDKPAKVISIEDLVKEVKKTRPDPIELSVAGERFTIQNPNELYWRKLVAAQQGGDAEEAIKIYLGDQFEAFDEATHMENDVLELFLKKINKHFGVDDSGN